MKDMKQKDRSRPRPVWVDNWLIRERVARWRARDRVKDWLRRLPRRVAVGVVTTYAALSTVVFSLLIWWSVKHPGARIIDGPLTGSTALAVPQRPPAGRPKPDLLELRQLLLELRSDSSGMKALEDYLRLNPAMADSLKELQRLYPALRY